MEQPKRKSIRLKDYDYSNNGAYFITICTKDRRPVLSQIVAADDPVRRNEIHLSEIGNIVLDCWCKIDHIYTGVRADKLIIMPNHIHGIITIYNSESEEKDTSLFLLQRGSQNEETIKGGQSRPPLQKIIQGFKSVSTRRCYPLGYNALWQKSFYDHIIRDENEYTEIWEYIDSNMQKWREDKYYST